MNSDDSLVGLQRDALTQSARESPSPRSPYPFVRSKKPVLSDVPTRNTSWMERAPFSLQNEKVVVSHEAQDLRVVDQTGPNGDDLPTWMPNSKSKSNPKLSVSLDWSCYQTNTEPFQFQKSSLLEAVKVSGYKLATVCELIDGYNPDGMSFSDSEHGKPWHHDSWSSQNLPTITSTSAVTSPANMASVCDPSVYYRKIRAGKAVSTDYVKLFASSLKLVRHVPNLISRKPRRIATAREERWRNLATSTSGNRLDSLPAYVGTLLGGVPLPGLGDDLRQYFWKDLYNIWLESLTHHPIMVTQEMLDAEEMDIAIKQSYREAMGESVSRKSKVESPVKSNEVDESDIVTQDAMKIQKATLLHNADNKLQARDNIGLASESTSLSMEESKRQEDVLIRQQIARSFNHRVECMSTGRKFASTDQEMGFGWVPGSTETGDEIWILPGVRVPLALRLDPERSKVYRVVGDAYYHGVMNGEFFSGEHEREMTKLLQGPPRLAQREHIELIDFFKESDSMSYVAA